MPSFCIIPASNLMLCSTIGPLYFSITSRAAPRQSSHASAHPCRASPNWIVRILSRTSDKPVVSVSTPITGLRSPSQRRNSSNSSRLSTSVSWMLSNDASSSALAKICPDPVPLQIPSACRLADPELDPVAMAQVGVEQDLAWRGCDPADLSHPERRVVLVAVLVGCRLDYFLWHI